MAKRRRIRWDRITAAAAVLLVLIFLLGSCMRGCGKDKDESSLTDPKSPGSAAAGSSVPGSSGAGASGASSEPGAAVSDGADSASASSVLMPESSAAAALPSDYQYVTMLADAVHKGRLVLVNSSNPSTLTKEDLDLEQVYYSQDRPDYEVSYSGHTTLNKTALAEFNRLMRAYITETGNTEIMFNYGYLETGKEKSNPESATALDIQLHLKLAAGGYSYISNTKPYSWLFDHMADYGFILRYPDGKTDLTGERGTFTAIRYVGLPHAKYIAENDLCLEEYLTMLRDTYVFGKNMLTYTTDSDTYKIYYVAADPSGDTMVPVPNEGMWEISGNNIDGFIVTTYGG